MSEKDNSERQSAEIFEEEEKLSQENSNRDVNFSG
jgi:hypothetical protein